MIELDEQETAEPAEAEGVLEETEEVTAAPEAEEINEMQESNEEAQV